MKLTSRVITCLYLVFSMLGNCEAAAHNPPLFPDAGLQAAVSASLGIENRPIEKADLAAIIKLDANGRGISSLDNLELLTNLTQLDLTGNRINDLEPLKSLPRLQTLILASNRIKSIAPLRHLRNLKHLDLSDNEIEKIEPLRNLVKLAILDLRHNRIESLSAFRQFEVIPHDLRFHGNPFIYRGIPGHYLNEIRRSHLESALTERDSPSRLLITEVMASAGKTEFGGRHYSSDWIELYNAGMNVINLKGFGLADTLDPREPWLFPDISLGPAQHIVVWASGRTAQTPGNGLHADFRISRRGESIYLTDPKGDIIDAIRVPPALRDISFGRRPGNRDAWIFFEHPTPGSTNICLDFSHATGFYTAAFRLALTTPHKNTDIHYSLDGSVPTPESPRYHVPIDIGGGSPKNLLLSNINTTSLDWAPPKTAIFSGTVVRARLFRQGRPLGPTVTKTYFVDPGMHQRYSLPIVSLVVDPQDLLDFEDGIYVMGKKFVEFRTTQPNYVAGVAKRIITGNYSQKGLAWERPVHIDFFEPNGLLGFSQNAGIRIFGGSYNRKLAQKPLILYARKQYDTRNEFNYDIFPGLSKSRHDQRPHTSFKHLILRTSGQDARRTLMADALMQSLVDGILDVQAYRPVIVFLNGEYWGIYNLREHMDEHYIQSHFDLAREQVVLLENFATVKSGSRKNRRQIRRMLRFLKQNSLADQGHYNHIASTVDTGNFMDYCIAQIYFNNKDWPGNNMRYWKKAGADVSPDTRYGHDGRWRWLLYDTDYGFGTSGGRTAYRFNLLKMATAAGGEHWPNPDKSTRLLRSLLQNADFRKIFINRLADHLNTIFKAEAVAEKISRMTAVLSTEMPEHINRWGGSVHNINSMAGWEKQVRRLVTFAQKRPHYLRGHVQQFFQLGGESRLILNISPPGGGRIKINSVEVTQCSPAWQGVYFKDIPVTIQAVPNEGYTFSGWAGDLKLDLPAATIHLKNDTHLTALFKK